MLSNYFQRLFGFAQKFRLVMAGFRWVADDEQRSDTTLVFETKRELLAIPYSSGSP